MNMFNIVAVIIIISVIYLTFKRDKNKTKPSPSTSRNQAGNNSDTVEGIRQNYNLSLSEMEQVLRRCKLNPNLKNLKPEDRDKVIDEILSPGSTVVKKAPKSPKKTPQKNIFTPPPVPEHKPIKDKGHKIILSDITDIPDEKISRSKTPQEGSRVFTEKGKEYILSTQLGAGGEGIVYEINSGGNVAKIYDEEHCTRRRYQKIKAMIQSKLKCKGICLPIELLYNSQKEFVGYTMKKAQGSSLDVLFNYAIFERKFPNWKKAQMIDLSLTILRKIKYLHDHDVIIGDINPRNILVVSTEEVYFVDTDSYQYKGFPCPVGTPEYTAPEIQKKDFGKFLRTQGNENFTVAILLFRLMMQGKSPYAYVGGGNPVENIMNGFFPYPAYGQSVPNSFKSEDYRFVWSWLLSDLKKAFWDTFHKNGVAHSEESRYSVDVWTGLMYYYKKRLSKLTEQDLQYNELFPNSLNKGNQ